MFSRAVGSLFSLGLALCLAPACSTTFEPRVCKLDSDCGGSGLVCVENATSANCAEASQAPLRIGLSAPLSGPSVDLGAEMKRGLDLAFAGQNAKGGVNGRPIVLVASDDEYVASLAEQRAHELIDVQEDVGVTPKCPTTLTPPAKGAPVAQNALHRGPNAVLAVVGNVGTPTMVRFAPIAVETGTLFFGAFTGASTMLRDDSAGACHRFIFNVRASYGNEAEATIEFFRKRGVTTATHIVSFDQNDAFGQAGYDGLGKAYTKLIDPAAALDVIPRFRYTKDDPANVETTIQQTEAYLASLLDGNTDKHTVGILMTDTYGPGATFIKEIRSWQFADPDRAARLDFFFSNVSFVGPNSLASRLKDAGTVNTPNGPLPLTTNVFVSQVVPNYDGDQSDVVRDYLAALAATGAQPTFTSLEGYVTGRVFAAGLVAHQGAFTPEALIKTFETLPDLALGLGGSSGFQNGGHDYSRTVWGTSIDADGKFENLYYWSEGNPIRFFE